MLLWLLFIRYSYSILKLKCAALILQKNFQSIVTKPVFNIFREVNYTQNILHSINKRKYLTHITIICTCEKLGNRFIIRSPDIRPFSRHSPPPVCPALVLRIEWRRVDVFFLSSFNCVKRTQNDVQDDVMRDAKWSRHLKLSDIHASDPNVFYFIYRVVNLYLRYVFFLRCLYLFVSLNQAVTSAFELEKTQTVTGRDGTGGIVKLCSLAHRLGRIPFAKPKPVRIKPCEPVRDSLLHESKTVESSNKYM